MKSRKILVWFRNDLRLHDNEMLVEAIAKSDSILPVYFFDPRYVEYTGTKDTVPGNSRVQFLIESVSALRQSLRKLGGDLLLISGKPEDHIPALVEQYEIAEVYHHREVATKETNISSNVEDLLWKLKVNLKHFIGHTLYNKEDLPFPIKDIPDIFTQFKKKTERDAIVKDCFLSPETISFVQAENWGELPEYTPVAIEGPRGGEEEGIKHLKALLNEGAAIYVKNSGKGHADKNIFSSKLSPWLAVGCLSPRKVYWAVKSAENRFGSNPNFTHLILGLLWRDYFRFMFKKHSGNFFKAPAEGEKYVIDEEEQAHRLQAWRTGATGHKVVDQYMQELNNTGYISHTGRLMVATFLIYMLKINWVDGAIYFEEKLVDYSPASNWGNWANVAEGGKDPRSKNTFDLDKQIKLLDIAFEDSTGITV